MARNTYDDRFTRWAAIASGEGGGRIATRFFTRRSNPGIENRIVVMNTNRADIRNTIQRLEGRLGDDDFEDHVFIFGDAEGAGNVFADGEALARNSFDRILRSIDSNVETADAFMHIATLGGGTGNGSIPYTIRRLKGGIDTTEHPNLSWMNDVIHTAFGVWPYEDEPPQQQFNAVCGLSRLLRTPDGSQNADMALLGANSHIAKLESNDEPNHHPNDLINERLIEAFDLLISAGRETQGVIDVQDYISVPSQIGAYHFTPAVATEMDANVYDLEYMFDVAAGDAFVPLDVSTTKAAYAIVRAPRKLANSEITESDVKTAFETWKSDRGIEAPGMSTVSVKDGGRSKVDVLLLLGGFDLEPLLSTSWDAYETHKDRLDRGRRLGNTSIPVERMQQIEENLDEYRRVLKE